MESRFSRMSSATTAKWKIASHSKPAKLNIKNKSQKQLRLEYSYHIHGIAIRIAGVTFATLPTINKVVISGYSQRLDSATGNINDDYLYSIKFVRDKFNDLNFENLEMLNPVETISIFEHIRKMTKTGIFKAIEPFIC